MIHKELGTTGIEIPALGLGTWGIGGNKRPDYSRDEKNIEAIEKAVEMGYTHIDTADIYGGGHTEELVGEAIQGFDRDELFIVSKIYPHLLSTEKFWHTLKTSVERLQTDYIDLYLIHCYRADTPLREGLVNMAEAVEEGLVDYVGVSNFDKSLLKRAMRLSPEPVTCNQVLYNLKEREPEEDNLLTFCQKKNVTFTAYSPFQTGDFSPGEYPALEEIARDHDATAYQIVLAWLLAKERMLTIPKSTDIPHLKENLEAAEIVLTAEEMERLNQSKRA